MKEPKENRIFGKPTLESVRKARDQQELYRNRYIFNMPNMMQPLTDPQIYLPNASNVQPI
jgi:hypothetical protein